MGFPGGSDGKVSACNTGYPGSIPGSGRSLGEGNGNPLQYSCLEKIPWTEEPGGLQSMGSQELDTTGRLSTVHTELSLIPQRPSALNTHLPAHLLGLGAPPPALKALWRHMVRGHPVPERSKG